MVPMPGLSTDPAIDITTLLRDHLFARSQIEGEAEGVMSQLRLLPNGLPEVLTVTINRGDHNSEE